MFRDVIRSTAMTTPAAESYFETRIAGDSFNGDVTLTATLRALLDSRIPAGGTMSIINRSWTYYDTNEAQRQINLFLREYTGITDSFMVHDIRGGGDTLMSEVCKYMKARETDGWKQLEEVTALFRKSFEVCCFVNQELRSSMVVVRDMSMKKYHLLQCAILGMVPWYYDPQAGLQDLEKELIYSLRENTPAKYIDAINAFAERYNFEYERMKTLLTGFESRVELARIDELDSNNDIFRRRIEEYNNKIGEMLEAIDNNNIILLGLRERIKGRGDDSELLQYFSHNKHLILDNVNGQSIYFTAKGYVEYFDEDSAARCIGNRSSFVYDRRIGDMSDDDIEKFLTAIFLKQEIRIRFCAAYRFNMHGSVEARSDCAFGPSLNTYMPNPHIQRYACMGNYLRNINTLLKESNYIAAFEQCIASCQSLNWLDGAVMSAFISYLDDAYSSNKKCFELPDGTLVSIKEVMQFLNSENHE